MFSDPLGVTVNGVAKNLVRINQDGYSSEYQLVSATDKFNLIIRNSSRVDSKSGIEINRHNIQLVQTVFPVAPSTRSFTRKAYFVFENETGDTLLDPRYVATALQGLLTSGTLDKLLNSES
jgi:hypothetical protein